MRAARAANVASDGSSISIARANDVPLVVGPARDRHPAVADAGFVGAGERAVRDCARVAVAVAEPDLTVPLVVEQPGRQAVVRALDL